MYKKGYYNGKTEEEIKKEIINEGFDPVRITNTPNFVYPKHKHPEKKLLAFLSGSMEVIIQGETYVCTKGDKILIEGNTEHSAVVGEKGCMFYWSEKI